MNALGAYLLSKALSSNYAKCLQKIFDKHSGKLVDNYNLARLGFACQHIECIAATLNLQIKDTELCSLVLVDARGRKKDYTKKYKEGKGKGNGKKGGKGKTTHELIVKKEGLEWGEYKVTRKKSKGKDQLLTKREDICDCIWL